MPHVMRINLLLNHPFPFHCFGEVINGLQNKIRLFLSIVGFWKSLSTYQQVSYWESDGESSIKILEFPQSLLTVYLL
jgi:hypothetical protein